VTLKFYWNLELSSNLWVQHFTWITVVACPWADNENVFLRTCFHRCISDNNISPWLSHIPVLRTLPLTRAWNGCPSIVWLTNCTSISFDKVFSNLPNFGSGFASFPLFNISNPSWSEIFWKVRNLSASLHGCFLLTVIYVKLISYSPPSKYLFRTFVPEFWNSEDVQLICNKTTSNVPVWRCRAHKPYKIITDLKSNI